MLSSERGEKLVHMGAPKGPKRPKGKPSKRVVRLSVVARGDVDGLMHVV